MKKIIYGVMLFALVSLGKAVSAQAATGDLYNVDVNGANYTGVGILTNAGTPYWTTISSAAGQTNQLMFGVEDLVGGGNPSYRLTYAANSSTAIGAGQGTSSNMAGDPSAQLFDGYMTSTGQGTILLTGLAHLKDFQMVVYSQAESGVSSALSINGNSVLSNPLSSATALTQGVNYEIINGLQTNASGTLAFHYQGQMSGFQLQELSTSAVPEPSTIVLMGVGGLLFVALRLRKSHATSTLVA